MDILQTVWTALTTENEGLTNIIIAPLVIIEAIVSMLLFTTLLNVKSTKKQKIIYITIISLLGLFCNSLLPKQYSNIITLVCTPFIIMFVFKINFFKSLAGEVIPLICIALSETIISRLMLLILNVPFAPSANIPIYRLVILLSIYLMLFIIYSLIKHFHININIFDAINKRNKRILIINLILAIIAIFTQFFLIIIYNDSLPSFIVILSTISLLAYFIISIYSLSRTMKLEVATTSLEEATLYNKTLQILQDNTRAFKHDFGNIVQGIGGYINTNDMDSLRKYYSQLLEDCQRVNNLTTLSPEVINNPAVYNVLANKYHKADEKGIKINLESFLDLNELHIKIYEFTRILGILMDNAIEATSECENKTINVYLKKDSHRKMQLLIIENTYKDKQLDTEKIYEKGFSTKKGNSGLGLWEIRQILKKNDNLNLYTTKNQEFFKQQLEIFY